MITHIDYYIPHSRISVGTVFENMKEEKLPVFFETKEDGISFFENILNLKEVSSAGNITETELIDALLLKNIAEKKIEPSQIDLIMLIDDALDRGERIDNLGQYIQHTYGFKKANLLVLGGNHCANVEYAIDFGEQLLKAGDIQSILIIAINKVNDMNDRVIDNYAILGDGAGIALLKSNQENGVHLNGSFSITNGSLYDTQTEPTNPIVLFKNYLLCISGLLKKYNIEPSYFSEVIVQNANYSGLLECLTNLGFKSEQLNIENSTRYGHIDCIDFLINLKSIMLKETDTPSRILSFGNGTAGSNICLNLEIVP